MSSLNTYDAGEVNVVVGTRRLKGLAEDTFVEVERDENTFTKQIGSDGETTRSKTRNKGGQIRITLQQGSEDNAYMQGLHNQDENDGSGIVPVKVTDKSGTAVATATQAWVMKPSSKGYSREAGTRQWIMDTGRLDETGGGN